MMLDLLKTNPEQIRISKATSKGTIATLASRASTRRPPVRRPRSRW